MFYNNIMSMKHNVIKELYESQMLKKVPDLVV